jgi:NAD-dependent dihydropyrimidine dehydrogenase PreA subunit
MVNLGKNIMEYLGLNPDRLRIEFMSGGEGNLFVEVVNDFIRQVKGLGPLGESEGLDEAELKNRLEDVYRLVPYIKQAKREKLEQRFETIDEYAGLYTREEVADLIEAAPAYYIDPEKCQACSICLRRCPVEAIDGGKNLVHIIDQEKCIKCGTCFEACPPKFGAVQKLAAAEPVPAPLSEEARVIVRGAK